MRAQALLGAMPRLQSRNRRHMNTNLCRCGTHMRIIRAVERAAGFMKDGGKAGSAG